MPESHEPGPIIKEGFTIQPDNPSAKPLQTSASAKCLDIAYPDWLSQLHKQSSLTASLLLEPSVAMELTKHSLWILYFNAKSTMLDVPTLLTSNYHLEIPYGHNQLVW